MTEAIPATDLRARYDERITPTVSGYEIRGPLCSDGLHHFVVHLQPVHAPVLPLPSYRLREYLMFAAGGLCYLLCVLSSLLTIVGWFIIGSPLAALGNRLFKRADERREAFRFSRESRMTVLERAADSPWRWHLARSGTDPWPSTVVDDPQILWNLGVHHPAKDSTGGWAVGQAERSLADTVAIAEVVLAAFTY